jgi:hypothetical protein
VVSNDGSSFLFNSLFVRFQVKTGSRVQGFKGSRVQGFKGSRVLLFWYLSLIIWVPKGKPKAQRSKQKGSWFGANHCAALTSRSRRPRYARRLNSSVSLKPKSQNTKSDPVLVAIESRGFRVDSEFRMVVGSFSL